MPGRMEFDFQFHNKGTGGRRHAGAPMRMLLLGDFNGRGRRIDDETSSAKPAPVAVDIDNFEAVMARLGPALEIPGDTPDASPVQLGFNTLDDFHPDNLFDRLAPFTALRETRARLKDPATFSRAAAEMRQTDHTPPTDAAPGPDAAGQESDTDTFERLLGRSATPAGQHTSTKTRVDEHGLRDFVARVVAPYIVPDTEPGQALYVEAVDEAIAQHMRAILHAPAFQALESLWRAVWWLISSVETGDELQLYLIDVTQQELAADIETAGDDLSASQIYRVLVEDSVDASEREGQGGPWSLLMGDFSFGSSAEDLDLLAALGDIASQAGGPFIARGDMGLLGCQNLARLNEPRQWTPQDDDLSRHWHALRSARVAKWIGLALPRVLLRLPYGKGGEPLDRFDFEEVPQSGPHEAFLWGSPAVFCGLALARGFQDRGWDMSPGDYLTLGELPAYVQQVDGEKQLLACAEQYLSEHSAESILTQGLMPLVSYRDRNAARLLRFQSIAEPLSALAGPWD
ncbi:MAG: hypothetical protein GXP17_08040 [Gammaproteobacteria bacterium]|nr:hypothetical protein [Gammaproteobacteria bacterium]